MSKDDAIRKKVLKLLEKKPDTDSFEIAIMLREPIADVNRTLEDMSGNCEILICN